MKTQGIVIAHPDTPEQADALKAFMKALKIKFETAAAEAHDPGLVAKIERSRKQYQEGDFVRVDKNDLQKFLGLE